ncbi:chitotriosidase-1-like [Mizuhopecten yessoensis]|uniref:chitotriosidase-1-like n=1 Tax=Mizuhopecten yessoensis TaxID=6573 RepID=UPI000B45D99E|nr:chitotriosidase-1-like [Mizuhopecten yessoensis]
MVDLKVFLSVAVVLCLSYRASGERRLLCYYDIWAAERYDIGAFTPDMIDPYLCTHIVMAQAMVRKNKPKVFRRVVADMKYYIPFTNLTLINPKLKSLVLLADSTAGDMDDIVQDSTSRATFTQSAIDFCRKYSFDGFAIAWKKPNATNFLTVSQDLRAAFDNENTTSDRLLLVADLVGQTLEDVDAYYDKYTIKSTIMDNYDFVNTESFSLFSGSSVTAHHSRRVARDGAVGAEKFGNMKSIAEYFAFLGIPKSMINVGMATYGGGYTLANESDFSVGANNDGPSTVGLYSETLGFMSYYEICKALEMNQGAMYRDYGVPYYVNGSQWIGYDDTESFKEKAEWIVEEGYGGAAVWSFTFDDYSQYCNKSDRRFPLINTVKDVFVEADTPKQYRRVCYFTVWSENRRGDGKFMAEDIDPNLCTHVIVAFAEVSDDCELQASSENDTMIYERVTALKTNNADLKVLLSVGGWEQGSESFSFMVSRPKRRRTFANSTVAFLRLYGFDGLDLAWQYPAQREGSNEDTDKKNFGILVDLLSRQFENEVRSDDTPRLMLTAAVAAEQEHIDYAYDVKALSESLDFLSIQTFDMHGYWDEETGHHSQLKAFPWQTGTEANLNMDWAGRYWQMLGVDKEKINIGVATFGRGFDVDYANKNGIGNPFNGPSAPGNYTEEAGFLAYYEICNLNGTRDYQSSVPFMYGDEWIGYDDETSIMNKMIWLAKEGYGGAMVWALDLDDFRGNCMSSNGPFPLISTVKNVLTGYSNGSIQSFDSTSPTTTWDTTTMSETTTLPPSSTQEAFIDCNTSPTGGPYPNTNDCRTFYKCSHGVAHLYNCPGNTAYDRALRVCNWSSFTNC